MSIFLALVSAPEVSVPHSNSYALRFTSVSADKVPLLHLERKFGANCEYSSSMTGVYLDILHEIATSGTTFKDKNALLTGVGKGSIGVEILKGPLSGGAHVVITTSRYNRKTAKCYQSTYQGVGSRGLALTIVPFNLDDYILLSAAIPENGREMNSMLVTSFDWVLSRPRKQAALSHALRKPSSFSKSRSLRQ